MGLQCRSKNEMVWAKMLKLLFIFYSLFLSSALTLTFVFFLHSLSRPSLVVAFRWRFMADLVGRRW